MVSPGVIPQHSIPLPLPLQPLRQQRRPSQGRSGQHQQQPLVNSKPASTTIDIQRVGTMRCVPLSRNGRTGHSLISKFEIRNSKTEIRNPKWTTDMRRSKSEIRSSKSEMDRRHEPAQLLPRLLSKRETGRVASQSCPRNLRKPN